MKTQRRYFVKDFFMNIKDSNIDNGKVFDWGRTSHDYAKYRDIYPDEFYRRITDRGLCVSGQSVLDIGTGTGVIPRNMLRFGAKWTGTDISPEQIEQAKLLSQGTDIKYYVSASEELSFPDNSFDVITACQCFWYFDHEKLIPEFRRMLKSGGSLVVLYMAWLPFEDKIAGMSEELVLNIIPTGAARAKQYTRYIYRSAMTLILTMSTAKNILSMCISHERAGMAE